MAYTFDQVFAADPSNPSNVAQNAAVTIFAPGDGTMTPLTITDPDGQPLANPLTVNANGFGSAFAHATLDRVAWAGGGFTGFFTSYDGMKNEAVAAREAAEQAAATAGADAAAAADAALSSAVTNTATSASAAQTAQASAAVAADAATASAAAAASAASLVGAPADPAIAAAISGTGETKTALTAAVATATGVTATDPAHTTKLIPGTGKNGLFIRSEQASYAVKVDQYDNAGVHDTMNIAANFGGAHTPFSVNAGNTTLSTVKIVNAAVQTGGAVIAAVGSNAGRTAELYGADNSGTGPSYLSTMKGGNGIAFRAAYDAGSYNNSIMWGTGHHTGGNLFFIENDGAHTSGATLKLSETNASSTVSIISVTNSGTGESITAPSFNLLKDGRTKLKQIENLTSFNNGQVKMTDAGIVADRNVADASPVVKIQNIHASSTGDILQIVKTGGVVVSRFGKNGTFITKANAAPADADILNSEMSLWYDVAAGAFKIKAKDASGVVRTGTVALA